MLRKLLIRVWLGPLPDWSPRWLAHVEHLKQYGWDFLLLNDTEDFRYRCERVFGFPVDPQPGTRKPCEYDPALGELYADKIEGYDFWGHCNLDAVYGRLDKWLSDEFLSDCDIFGNDPNAICGPLSVYRNTATVNALYRRAPMWQEVFQSSNFYGFDEGVFNAEVQRARKYAGLRFKSGFYQSHDTQPGHDGVPQLGVMSDGALLDRVTGKETMMFHFHRYRQWPIS
jgi:hypothetical protein